MVVIHINKRHYVIKSHIFGLIIGSNCKTYLKMESVKTEGNKDLSTDEFIEFMKSKGQKASTINGRLYVHGLMGLATLLECSKPTAYNLKSSGRVSYLRVGVKKLLFDVHLVLEQLNIDNK